MTESDVIKVTIETCKFLIELNEELSQLLKYEDEHFRNK